jgi:uncharacterized protein YjbI with pentapeptide repeats
MTVLLSPVGGVAAQFLDNNGNPLSGGKLFSYSAGTTTPAATFTSSLGVTAHTNPIVLDSGGRVPGGETWLTDGIIYKFVLQTSTNVLIATYDNIVGINSNFVNYTTEQEIQTATAGQTVFDLTTMQYQPGTNSLSVFVDGVNQYGPGAQYAYLETDTDTVTFVSGLHVGASVKFTTATQVTGNATDASVVTYNPPFTGGVPTNVEAKLAQTVSVKDFGAVGDGVTDDTAAFNLATFAAEPFSTSVSRRSIYIPAGRYLISGTVYVRKGQALYGDGGGAANLFMGSTGSIVMGKNSSGVEDPGGAPPAVRDIFMEGGNTPISVEVSGYSVENVFFNSSATGPIIGGSDGKITNCIFDNGSTLMRLRGGGHTINGCTFYLGNTQVGVSDRLNNTSFVNCAFAFPVVQSINFQDAAVDNCVFDNCTFAMNEQFSTHVAYVKTTSTAPGLQINAQFSNCGFYNGKGYAFKIDAGGFHDIEINNCVFDGNRSSSGFAQSTTFQAIELNATSSVLNVRGCVFRNLLNTPVVFIGANAMTMNLLNSSFSNNAGSYDIAISNTNNASRIRLGNIIGSGRQLYGFTVNNTGVDLDLSGLQNWFDTGSSGGRNYAKIPYQGASLWDVFFVVNPTNGVASTLYRTVEAYKAAVYYGNTPANPSTHTKLVTVAQFADAGISASDITIEFNSVGGGQTINSAQTLGDLYISWDSTYFAAAVSVQPNLQAKVG